MSAFASLIRRWSLRTLILGGFFLVLLPLTAMVWTARDDVELIASSSQDMTLRVAQLSKQSQALRDSLVDFERKAKQFIVLQDQDTKSTLAEAYQAVGSVLQRLEQLDLTAQLSGRLDALRRESADVYEELTIRQMRSAQSEGRRGKTTAGSLKQDGWEADRLARTTERFADLSAKARELSSALSNMIAAEFQALGRRSEAIQSDFLAQASVLVPISLAAIVFVVVLTMRSIRQMDLAIRRIGSGNLKRAVRVRGPKDMEYLGERLDWLRERLSQLEAAKQQFMRHVSHELKTPLATIHEGAELLADDVVGELNTEQRDIANILTTSTKRLENLIEQLLTYSQANGLPVEGNYVKVDTAGLVAKVIEDNQIRIRARSITVTTNLQPVWIEGYPEQLATIIDNLLSNAIKHSPADGKIHFDLREIGGHMVLEIEDEGPGIPVDERERVFEPFYQGQAVKASGVGGTGLGLAIVSECVARHHGKVEALHPRLGKNGARIRVSIPCRQRE